MTNKELSKEIQRLQAIQMVCHSTRHPAWKDASNALEIHFEEAAKRQANGNTDDLASL